MCGSYRIINYDGNDLSRILENNYPQIFEQINNESYILEYESFVEFRELIYEDVVVGFLTLDTFLPSDFILCLNECYILPEYRGKGILMDIIKELLEDESLRFYIRKPNYNFIKFLLKHNLAFEVAPDIVSSHLKFVFKADEIYTNKQIKRLYKKPNSNSKDLSYYAAGFHMGLCSIFGVDPLTEIVKDNNTLMFTLPRKTDLKRFDLRKKLKRLTVNKIMDIQFDYAINNDKIDEFNKEVSSSFNENNDDVLIIGHGDETLIFENLKPNDVIRIENAVEEEFKNGNLSFSSADIRFDYLLNHPEEIDKTIDLNKDEENIVSCQFCGESVENGEYCKICGQLYEPLHIKSMLNKLLSFK